MVEFHCYVSLLECKKKRACGLSKRTMWKFSKVDIKWTDRPRQLLMLQKSGEHHLGRIKPVINNGISTTNLGYIAGFPSINSSTSQPPPRNVPRDFPNFGPSDRVSAVLRLVVQCCVWPPKTTTQPSAMPLNLQVP